jgi:plasmid stabilization system protein ParE
MSSSPHEQDNSPVVFAIRFTQRARREIKESRDWLASLIGDDLADEWEAGFLTAVRGLATMPGRYPIAPEDAYFSGITVRQMVYRRRSDSSSAFRVLFTAKAESDDGPVVTVYHVRHAARRPVSRAEARKIAAEG